MTKFALPVYSLRQILESEFDASVLESLCKSVGTSGRLSGSSVRLSYFPNNLCDIL